MVFVVTPREMRLQRLHAREATRFGADAVAPGGWRHREFEEFIDWAARYDDGEQVSRNLAKHQAWVAALSRPALRVDGSRPLPDLVVEVRRALDSRAAPA